jgi:hypothetical protein
MQISAIAAAHHFDPDGFANNNNNPPLPKYLEREDQEDDKVEGEIEEFDILLEKVDKMAQQVQNIKDLAIEFIRASKVIGESGFKISREIKGFYQEEQNSWLASSQISECLELGQGQIRYGHYKEMHEYVRSFVIAPLNYWIDEYKQVSLKNQARCVAKEKVEHYSKKIEKLRENARDAKRKGKIVSEKANARISRNEFKLETARKELDERSRVGLLDLQRIWNGRKETFGYVMKHFIDSQGLYFNKLASVANKLATAQDKLDSEGEYAFCKVEERFAQKFTSIFVHSR